jgi:small subunit ribosomal protein S4
LLQAFAAEGGAEMPPRKPRLKVIRRLGTALPGLTRKQPEWKTYPPGQHGPAGKRRKASTYKARLEEKQKLRYNYGVSERQLRHAFERAAKEPGPTGENLLALLERRLDNVVFRLGIAPTIPAGRQLVSHGHIRVNGRRLDRASYLVEIGDTITVSDKARNNTAVMQAVKRGPEIKLPSFLALDPNDPFSGRVIGPPSRNDVSLVVDEAAIVEFYAR